MAEDEGDMLSEDEIDALLDEADDESEDAEDDEPAEDMGTGGESIEGIRPVYEEIAESMENILGTILNREVTNQLVDCQFQTAEEIADALVDRDWVVIESELSGAVDGVARYILPAEHALVLADVMMGEDGEDPPEEFDEVYESAIVEMYNQVVNSLANKLNEITGQDIQLNPPESQVFAGEEFLDEIDLDMFLWVEYTFTVEDLINSGVLFELQPTAVADLILEATAEEEAEEPEPEAQPEPQAEAGGGAQAETGASGGEKKEVKSVEFPQFDASEGEEPVGNMNMLMDVPMEVSVELGRTNLQVKEILNLGAGSIIELERLAGEPVDLLVNGRLVARGEVVVIDENFGVRVTSIVSPMERIK